MPDRPALCGDAVRPEFRRSEPARLSLARLWRRLPDQGHWQVQDPHDLGTTDEQWRRVRADLTWDEVNRSVG